MTEWTEYAVALAVFVASHFLPRIGGLRDRLIAAVGRRTYFSAYGVLSVGLLVWVIAAAGRAPQQLLSPLSLLRAPVANLPVEQKILRAAERDAHRSDEYERAHRLVCVRCRLRCGTYLH